jgi:ATP diphosphatase
VTKSILDPSLPPIDRLLALMSHLRDPKDGCPWDIEQTFATITPHTIEEAYEVADAIQRNDLDDLRGELGDLLFQVVFHARMAEEAKAFDFNDVAAGLVDKMIRRHPHVSGARKVVDAAAQTDAWERLKAAERTKAKRADETVPPSAFDGTTTGLPALTRAIKLQNRAARIGFDWPSLGPVLDKLEEELTELRAEISAGSEHERLVDEFGDVLFVLANVARHLKLDPETALRGANAKFERRFRRIEALLRESGKSTEGANLAELDALWDRAKAEERA